MYKSSAASWFCIYEMFRFGFFHMYGIIDSAVILGIVDVQIIKTKDIKAISHQKRSLNPKNKSVSGYLIGAVIFGLAWADVCKFRCRIPVMLVVIGGALLGTFVSGLLRKYLPH